MGFVKVLASNMREWDCVYSLLGYTTKRGYKLGIHRKTPWWMSQPHFGQVWG